MSTSSNSTRNSIRTVIATPSDPVDALQKWLNGNSKFRNGLVVTITGFDFVQATPKGEDAPADDARLHPVFLTELGENDHIWLSSYKEDGCKYDFRGNPVRRDGSFDKEIEKILAEPITDATIDKLKAFKGRKLKVRRKLYMGINSYDPNKAITCSIPCFDLI